jgi:hypothetical protein
MNIENIEEGMLVRVKSDSLSETKSIWTLDDDGYMWEMRGKIYKVQSVELHRNGVTLYDKINDETWIFCPDDLSLLEIKKPKPPVMFDPKNIEIS